MKRKPKWNTTEIRKALKFIRRMKALKAREQSNNRQGA